MNHIIPRIRTCDADASSIKEAEQRHLFKFKAQAAKTVTPRTALGLYYTQVRPQSPQPTEKPAQDPVSVSVSVSASRGAVWTSPCMCYWVAISAQPCPNVDHHSTAQLGPCQACITVLWFHRCTSDSIPHCIAVHSVSMHCLALHCCTPLQCVALQPRLTQAFPVATALS